jgi:hypothetical protein
MLTRYRAPLLTAQKTVNLHRTMPKLRAFSKDFMRAIENIIDCRAMSTHCGRFRRAWPLALR